MALIACQGNLQKWNVDFNDRINLTFVIKFLEQI